MTRTDLGSRDPERPADQPSSARVPPQAPAAPLLGVIGVLVSDGGELLLIQRAAGITHAGAWCFPGGHVDPGETSRDAVRRELAEELAIEIEPLELLGQVRVPSATYVLDVWTVRLLGGTLCLNPAEVADARYMSAAEIRAIPAAMPSNEHVLALLRS